MRIVVTADLHYDITRSVQPARELAAEICGLRADALMVLGDVAGRRLSILSEALHLFDSFSGRKFFVAGNHDIWTDPGEDSLQRFEQALPAVCREAGFHPLDTEPAWLNGIALVGCMPGTISATAPSTWAFLCAFTRKRSLPAQPTASELMSIWPRLPATFLRPPSASALAGWTAGTSGWP